MHVPHSVLNIKASIETLAEDVESMPEGEFDIAIHILFDDFPVQDWQEDLIKWLPAGGFDIVRRIVLLLDQVLDSCADCTLSELRQQLAANSRLRAVWDELVRLARRLQPLWKCN